MTYVISDIHGNLKAFYSILDKINLQSNDRLYILGDVIDRYDGGIEILQRIISMENVYMILGNHEYMMMDALCFPYESNGCTSDIPIKEKIYLWHINGGKSTHLAWLKLSNNERNEIINYLKNLPLSYDIVVNHQRFVLVHATWDRMYDIITKRYSIISNQSKAYFTVWDRSTIGTLSDIDDFITIFGHTTTDNFKNYNPLRVYRDNNIIGIDCGAGFPHYNHKSKGRLACIRLEDMKIIYSNFNKHN